MVNFTYQNLNRAPQRLAPQKVPTLKYNQPQTTLRVGRRLGGFGDAQLAVKGASAGASVGSAVMPVFGTAIGAVVGAVAGMLVHVGQGALRAQQAQAIDQALAQLSTANHQGAAIPWNGTATQPGLLQLISALMTSGIYMSWDSGVVSSPSINGNWSTTFVNAIKALVGAIVAQPIGAASVSIAVSPGAGGYPPFNFSFNNPGISVGPDVISASIVMGNGGLMYSIIKSLGETDAHAQANANNNAAQKVFALMVDHAAYDLVPPPPPPAPVAAPVAPTSAPELATTQQIVPTVQQTGTTVTGSPVVAPNDTNALMAQLMAQGATQQQALAAAMQSLEANGINSQSPQVQQQLQAASDGISTTTMLIIGGVAVAAYFLSQQNSVRN